MCWSDEPHPYPIRSFTYHTEQVRPNEVQKGDCVQGVMFTVFGKTTYYCGNHCYQLHTKFYPTLPPYVNKLTGGHQCGSSHNRPTTSHIFYMLSNARENVQIQCAMHHLYIHFCSGYSSVRKKVSYIVMRHITTFWSTECIYDGSPIIL